jgi:SAM-dependent methyltransferase
MKPQDESGRLSIDTVRTAAQTWEQSVSWLRSQPEFGDLVRDAYYDDPLLSVAQRFHRSPEWNAVRSWFPATRTVALDLGAGRGIASYALAQDGFRVHALEPDGSELVGAGAIRGLAQSESLPINVIQEFSEQIPLPDVSVDFVYARAVLHHTKDLRAACREVFRVLRPGGVFVGSREHVISRLEDLPVFLANHPLHRLYGGEHAFLLAEYLDAIKASGLRLRACLGPFDSPMNYSPRTAAELSVEIAQRLTRGIPGLKAAVASSLATGPVWNLAARLLSRVDRRPGRLYSFIAYRPS